METEIEPGHRTSDSERSVEEADRVLDEVERAMVRLDDGTYGRCERCDCLLADERLSLYPTARTCDECADTPGG